MPGSDKLPLPRPWAKSRAKKRPSRSKEALRPSSFDVLAAARACERAGRALRGAAEGLGGGYADGFIVSKFKDALADLRVAEATAKACYGKMPKV